MRMLQTVGFPGKGEAAGMLQDPVQQISIIPSGRALGYTLNPPKEDRYSVFRNELKERIVMLLGGRAAEEIVCNDISGGASNDIERATKTAKRMVMQLGMSPLLGPISYGTDESEIFLGRDFSAGSDHSEMTAAKIDQEVHTIIMEAYQRALDLLNANRDKMDKVAGYLMLHEVMDGEQFAALMDQDASYEELDAIIERRKQKSAEANAEKARENAEKEAAEKAAAEAAANQSDEQDPSDRDPEEDNGSTDETDPRSES